MNLVNVEGYSIVVKNVTKEELDKYNLWLEDKRYGSNMGYIMFPGTEEGRVNLFIESGFSGTWRREIYPDLNEYWGEDRIINEVEFVDDDGNIVD